MSGDGAQPKKRGRPPAPEDKRRRKQLTFRIRDDLRSVFEAKSKENGRSISEELEKTIEREATLSELVVNQEKLIKELQALSQRYEVQNTTYKEQIANYKSIIAKYDAIIKDQNKLQDNIKSINYYLAKQMYSLNTNMLRDLKAGKDITSYMGTAEGIEGVLKQLESFFSEHPEPEETDLLRELKNTRDD